jgi:hypothetical protein
MAYHTTANRVGLLDVHQMQQPKRTKHYPGSNGTNTGTQPSPNLLAENHGSGLPGHTPARLHATLHYLGIKEKATTAFGKMAAEPRQAAISLKARLRDCTTQTKTQTQVEARPYA